MYPTEAPLPILQLCPDGSQVMSFLDAGYFEMLADVSQLPMFWGQLQKDFPNHPALVNGSEFIDLPFAIYGRGLSRWISFGTVKGLGLSVLLTRVGLLR